MKKNSKILKMWKIVLLILITIFILFIAKIWYYMPYPSAKPRKMPPEQEAALINQRIENYTGRRIKGTELKDLLSKIAIDVSNSDAPAANSITIKQKEDNKPKTINNDFPEINRMKENSQKQDYLDKLNKLENNIRSNDHFKITATKKEKPGLIIEITIEDGENFKKHLN